jgi:hypothetical protein
VPRELASEADERRIAAAVATHRIAPARAAYYRDLALAGKDISALDTLVPCDLNAPDDADDDGDAIYAAFFPTVEQDRARADKQLRTYTARAAAPISGNQDADDKTIYESVFGPGSWDR